MTPITTLVPGVQAAAADSALQPAPSTNSADSFGSALSRAQSAPVPAPTAQASQAAALTPGASHAQGTSPSPEPSQVKTPEQVGLQHTAAVTAAAHEANSAAAQSAADAAVASVAHMAGLAQMLSKLGGSGAVQTTSGYGAARSTASASGSGAAQDGAAAAVAAQAMLPQIAVAQAGAASNPNGHEGRAAANQLTAMQTTAMGAADPTGKNLPPASIASAIAGASGKPSAVPLAPDGSALPAELQTAGSGSFMVDTPAGALTTKTTAIPTDQPPDPGGAVLPPTHAQAAMASLQMGNVGVNLQGAASVGSAGVAPTVPMPPATAPQHYEATLQSQVGSSAWGQNLGEHMLLAVGNQQQLATLKLNPPQLGPLEVHLLVQDGQVNAQFVSPHQAVRQALESAMPQLRDMFNGSGMSLGQASVNAGSGGWNAFQGQSQQRPGGGSRRPAVAGVEPQTVLLGAAAIGRGLVNTYV